MTQSERGFLILELDLIDIAADPPTLAAALEQIKETLDESTIEAVSHVHAAIGRDGLIETIKFLQEKHWPAQDGS